MVETCRLLPIVERVTAETVLPQLPAVLVRVASEAIARQAEEGAAQVLHLDGPALGLGNVAGMVTLLARKLGVPTLQHVSRFAVIEGFFGRFPVN